MRYLIVFLFVSVCLMTYSQIACLAEELDGIVVYFGFEDGTGEIVTDLSGNGQDGKLEGDTTWTDGKFDQGLNFGGVNGIVRVVHSHRFEFTDGITVCAWIRPTLIEGPGEWQLIAAKGPDIHEFFEILLHPQGYIWMGWRFSTGRVAPKKSHSNIVKGKWQHIAVSFQSGEWWTVYLNGDKLVDYAIEDGKLYPVESPLLLGTEEPLGLNRFYNGDMDEFVIFNRGLSQKEIRMLQRKNQDILAIKPLDKLTTKWAILKHN